MAMSLDDLIGKIVSMVEKSQAQGQANYGQARDDKMLSDKLNRIDALNKQKDINFNAREDRDKAMSLAGMQYGPGGSADRGFQSHKDVANIGLEGHKYTSDRGLEGHKYTADKRFAGDELQNETMRRGQDKVFEGQTMQYGPGGATDRTAALQYQKLTPEAQRAQHASDIAGRLAATGAAPGEVRAIYDSLSSQPANFSELNPNRQQGAVVQEAPYQFGQWDSTKRREASQLAPAHQPVPIQQQVMAPVQSRPAVMPQVEKQPGFIDALKYSNNQLGGKLLDPFGLNKKKKSTNPLFPNYGN